LLIIPFNNKVNLYENRPCVRIYSKNNRELFKAEVSKPDWPNEITSCTDPNLAYDKFYRKLEESFNKCFPLTKLSRKRSKDKLWMTTGLKNHPLKSKNCINYGSLQKTSMISIIILIITDFIKKFFE